MSDKYTYYSPEYMQDRKLSELKSNGAFLSDAITFLKSKRGNYTDDEIKKLSADDVVSQVLEHFRYQTMNEVSMSKDFYYMSDTKTPQNEKEAFGRLMFAFDNSKGEGLFDRGIEKAGDYLGATLTAPSTYASVLAGVGSAGTGTAAIQATKAASLAALRETGKQIIKRSLVSGAIDGSIAASSAFGSEKLREKAAPEIDEEYEVNTGNVVASGLLGAGIGTVAYGAPAMLQKRGANKLVDVIEEGRGATAERLVAARVKAKNIGKDAAKTKEGKRLMKYITDNTLRAIDPNLVKEGNVVRENIFSDELPDGIVGGFNADLIQRITAASYELAKGLGVKPEKGQRITEFLAKDIAGGADLVKAIADDYGLTPRQISVAYAAEISEAARKLAAQSQIVSRSKKMISKAQLEKYSKEIDTLYDAGMSTVKAEDVKVIEEVNRSLSSRVYRQAKGLEDARRMFMTSQPATTMRNNIFSVAMTGIDMIDQLNTSAVKLLSGNAKGSVATFKGTLDNLKYLTNDQYVADALVTTLRQESPDKLSRIFHDAAISESKVVGDTLLAKAGAAANTLNTMSDFVVKRAVIAGTIDRELKQLGNDALGTSVMDMLKKGTIEQLPDDILDKALKESLAFTFQRKFGGKEASAISKKTEELINFAHNNFLTIAVPFPRYLASQAKFFSDYSGITAIRHGFRAEDMGKAMTGAGLSFGAYYGVYSNKVHDDMEWYEARDPMTGQIRNAEAALGPAAAFAYVSDYAARKMEGLPVKKDGEVMDDMAKIFTGTEFRPGVGLYDDVKRAIDAGTMEPIFKALGDQLSAFTYPAAALKDFYGQFDPRSSYIAETRDPTLSMLDLYGINVPMNLYQRVTRQLPDFPDVDLPLVNFFESATRMQYQIEYAREQGIVDEGYDAIKFDSFGDGPVRLYNPIEKQLTGFIGRPPKNTLQKEMTRLQMDPFKLYSPYREKNATLELFTQQKLQGNLARAAEEYIQTDTYVNSPSATDKRNKLQGFLNAQITTARGEARDDLESFANDPRFKGDYQAYTQSEYQALGPKETERAEEAWAQRHAAVGYTQGVSFEDAIQMVDDDPDISEDDKSVKRTILYRTFIEWGKSYKKYLKSATE